MDETRYLLCLLDERGHTQELVMSDRQSVNYDIDPERFREHWQWRMERRPVNLTKIIKVWVTKYHRYE